MQWLASKLVAAGVASLVALAGNAQIVWNESVNGDFADENQRLSPTPVAFSAGSNMVIGDTGNSGSGVDRDYFRFTVPPGGTLTQVVVLDNTFVSGSSSFVAIKDGAQFTVAPNGTPDPGSGPMLGFMHYAQEHVNQNILPQMAPAFAAGLPPGTYSVWVQETGGPVDYGLNFVMTATNPAPVDVPIPAAAIWLLGGVIAAVGWLRSRTRR
jgi:hypothetical protein